jgi:hypothetical protein
MSIRDAGLHQSLGLKKDITAPGGQADFTDYAALYFINAAFMKWKHCLNNDTIIQTI